jgi:hypothetical protein
MANHFPMGLKPSTYSHHPALKGWAIMATGISFTSLFKVSGFPKTQNKCMGYKCKRCHSAGKHPKPSRKILFDSPDYHQSLLKSLCDRRIIGFSF